MPVASSSVRRTAFTLFLLFAALLLAGAEAAVQNGEGAVSGDDSPLSAAPESAGNLKNPFESQRDAALAGGKLFRRHCAECHGRTAQGTRRAPSLRAPAVEDSSPGALFWFLTNGNRRKGMPSWAGLPAEQRWQIISYLRTVR